MDIHDHIDRTLTTYDRAIAVLDTTVQQLEQLGRAVEMLLQALELEGGDERALALAKLHRAEVARLHAQVAPVRPVIEGGVGPSTRLAGEHLRAHLGHRE